MVPDFVVILSYAIFGAGALLILVALIRILWYCCVVRKDNKKQRKSFYDNPSHFSAHMTDPWLKENAILKRRLEDSHDKDSLRDVNISEFIHSHSGQSAKDLSDQLYETLTRDSELERTHIDSQTVETQAQYEEPNTNLIIAMKEKHVPPENTDASSFGSDTALVKTSSFKGGDANMTSRSEEAREALSALDLAMAEEDTDHKSDTETPRSHDESQTPRIPMTPHPAIATANEPLPGDSEMSYVFASTVWVADQGTTQL